MLYKLPTAPHCTRTSSQTTTSSEDETDEEERQFTPQVIASLGINFTIYSLIVNSIPIDAIACGLQNHHLICANPRTPPIIPPFTQQPLQDER